MEEEVNITGLVGGLPGGNAGLWLVESLSHDCNTELSLVSLLGALLLTPILTGVRPDTFLDEMMKMMKRELLRPEGWWQSWFSSSATAPALPHSFSFLGDEGTNMNSSLNIQQRQKWLLSASDNFSLLKTSEEESWPTVISSDLSVVLSSESFHCEWKCWFSKLREFVHVEEEAQLAFFASSSDPAAPSSLIPNSCWWNCKHSDKLQI